MTIYGVAILAFCYILGQLMGDYLGTWLHVQANVGGVGFGMLLLIIVYSWLEKKGWLDQITQSGIQFWNQMYIPVVVSMAATQNVRLAVSSGGVALIAGILVVIISFLLIPVLSKSFKVNAQN